MNEGQVPTRPVSIKWIMSDPAFERGVRDARAGRGFPADFDDWEVNPAWNYERGRAWAQRVPASVNLKRNGRITEEAMHWYMRIARDIL
jgi:hypothetical protein